MAKNASLMSSMGGPTAGSVVEVLLNNRAVPAYVLDEQAGKLRLFTLNKKEMKIQASRIMPWVGPNLGTGLSREDMEKGLAERQESREALEAGLDVAELWELAQGELDKARIDWFADLLWESPDIDRLAALGRAMLAAKALFKFQPPHFHIYTAEEVERRTQAEEARKAEELLVETGQAVFKKLYEAQRSGGTVMNTGLDPEREQALRELLRTRMARPDDQETNALWTAATKGVPDHPFLPLLLARGWGLVRTHHNTLMDEAGYAPGNKWSEAYAEECGRIATALDAARTEPEDTRFISIDSATTRDIDDALNLTRTDTGYHLAVALALPLAGWEFDSPLDQAVAARATSLYLPEGSSHMLPESVGLDLFSLKAGRTVPAMVLDMDLDDSGNLERIEPRTAWIAPAENITYEEAEERIAAGDPMLAPAYELAEKLLARRIERGAVIIRKPECQVVLDADPSETDAVRVDMELKPPCPAADLVVGEFMVLSNWAASIWAGEHGADLLHRTQDIALAPEMSGVWERPDEVYNVVRNLAGPLLETAPRPHACVGVPRYAPVTSPLRRYADFVNMAQIAAVLASGAPRWDGKDLDRICTRLAAALSSVSKVQRFRPRYWKLLYLRQNAEKTHPAVLVDPSGTICTLAMPLLQITVRVPKKMLGDKLFPGQEFQLRFKKIDPLTNEIKVAEAFEDQRGTAALTPDTPPCTP